MQIEHILDQMIDIAKQAGTMIKEQGNPEIFVKEGRSNFVTDMDLKSQHFIIEKLTPVVEGATFIAEEKLNEPHVGYCWIIDPIDGTTNFMHGINHSCVSIAFLQDDTVLCGVVYNPYLDEVFAAAKGHGATLNGKPIQVSQRDVANSLVFYGTSPYNIEVVDHSFTVIKRLYLATRDLRRSGSAALDLCYVACGRADAFYEAVLAPWDYAAATCIIQEANGFIQAIAPDVWGFQKSIGVVAGNPVNKEAFVALVEQD
ncbi:MAG: inositol monophosphatase family protein [Erysipelotrichaceae bacterium]